MDPLFEFQLEDLGVSPIIDSTINKNSLKKTMLKLEEFIENYQFIKDCHINFPTSILENVNIKSIRKKKLFLNPDTNQEDLSDLAYDPINDQRKKLNNRQIQELGKYGTITVKSQNFPNLPHIWKVSKIIQKGTCNIWQSFKKNIALALSFIIIVIPRLLYQYEYFSIKANLINFFRGIIYSLNLVIGVPSFVHKYDESEINKLMEEDIFDNIIQNYQFKGVSNNIVKFQDFNDEDFVDNTSETRRFLIFNFEELKGKGSKDPLGKNGSEDPCDLKNFLSRWNKFYFKFLEDWNQQANLKIAEIIENHVLDFNEENKLKNQQVKEEIQEQIYQYQEKLFFSHFKKEFYRDEPHMYHRLKKILLCILQLKRLEILYDQTFQEELKNYTNFLNTNYPIKSLISAWKSKMIDNFQEFYQENKSFQHFLFEKINDLDIPKQEKTLITQYLSEIYHPSYQILLKELSKERTYERKYSWKFPIWNPKNWKITRKEIVRSNLEKEYLYEAKKYRKFTTTNRYPFWRFGNLLFQILSFMMYFYYYLSTNFYHILKSQFTRNAFNPRKILNSKTGIIEPDPNYQIETYVSRFKGLWKHIKRSRQEFEDSSELSIIPKGIGRFFNRFHNYFVKAGLGFFILGLGQPILTLLSFILFPIALVLAPVISLIAAVLQYLFCLFLNDTQSEKVKYLPIFTSLIWLFLINGIFFLLMDILSIVFCFILPIFVVIWGLISNGVRYLYDSVIYLLFRKKLYIPGENSFLAQRISGPGLSSQVYYQIPKTTAKVLLYGYLENLELDLISKKASYIIKKNANDFSKGINIAFKPFGFNLQVSKKSKLAKKIQRSEGLIERIDQEISDRKKEIGLNHIIELDRKIDFNRVRMSAQDLEIFIFESQQIIKEFYQTRLIEFLNDEEIIMNDSTNIFKDLVDLNSEYTWNQITKKILAKIFTNNFLRSLEDIDSGGKLTIIQPSENWLDFSEAIFTNNYQLYNNNIDFRDLTPSVQINKFDTKWLLGQSYHPFRTVTKYPFIEQIINPKKEMAQKLILRRV